MLYPSKHIIFIVCLNLTKFKNKVKIACLTAHQQFTCAFAIPPITCNNPGPETHNTTAGFPK